jgi:hypothetical protein
MKLLTAIILTALLAYIGGIFLPWWSIALAAFIVAILVPQPGGMSFLGGLLGVFFLWVAIAWWIDMKNNAVLAQRMAHVLPLGGSRVLLLIVTGLVGGLVAGFAAMTGSYLRRSPRARA